MKNHIIIINGLDFNEDNKKWYEKFNPIKIFKKIEKIVLIMILIQL